MHSLQFVQNLYIKKKKLRYSEIEKSKIYIYIFLDLAKLSKLKSTNQFVRMAAVSGFYEGSDEEILGLGLGLETCYPQVHHKRQVHVARCCLPLPTITVA